MAMIIFFGGTSLVILIGIGTVIHGIHHHYSEYKKAKKSV
jgi:hypothetical protein